MKAGRKATRWQRKNTVKAGDDISDSSASSITHNSHLESDFYEDANTKKEMEIFRNTLTTSAESQKI